MVGLQATNMVNIGELFFIFLKFKRTKCASTNEFLGASNDFEMFNCLTVEPTKVGFKRKTWGDDWV